VITLEVYNLFKPMPAAIMEAAPGATVNQLNALINIPRAFMAANAQSPVIVYDGESMLRDIATGDTAAQVSLNDPDFDYVISQYYGDPRGNLCGLKDCKVAVSLRHPDGRIQAAV
jgi:hypothetical protein